MHELGVTFSIMDSLEDVAKKNEVAHISKVVLELGEVSTVIPDYLTDCWKWACKKRELFSNCSLEIIKLHALSYCEDCKQKYSTIQYAKVCPYCGSENTYLYCGDEFNIKEIEVNDN